MIQLVNNIVKDTTIPSAKNVAINARANAQIRLMKRIESKARCSLSVWTHWIVTIFSGRFLDIRACVIQPARESQIIQFDELRNTNTLIFSLFFIPNRTFNATIKTDQSFTHSHAPCKKKLLKNHQNNSNRSQNNI